MESIKLDKSQFYPLQIYKNII